MVYTQETKTIRNILKWAITTLKEAEIDSPGINADALLAFVLSCDRTNLYTNPDEILNDSDISRYKN